MRFVGPMKAVLSTQAAAQLKSNALDVLQLAVSARERMATGGPTVLITGCSAGGIGHALCIAFADAGCNVIATARRMDAMSGLRERGIECAELDVTSDASVRSAQSVIARADILVNNAGCARLHCACHLRVCVHMEVTKHLRASAPTGRALQARWPSSRWTRSRSCTT